MTDTPEPPDEFDQELADALEENHTHENVAHNAKLIATFYNTLTEDNVPHESAVEITCSWLGINMGG